VRRLSRCCGEQLSPDEIDGIALPGRARHRPAIFASAHVVEYHNRLRCGIPEESSWDWERLNGFDV
jgi:hypothetical protein